MAELGFEDIFQKNPEVLSDADAADMLASCTEALQEILDDFDDGAETYEATRSDLAQLKGYIAVKTCVRHPGLPKEHAEELEGLNAEIDSYLFGIFDRHYYGDAN